MDITPALITKLRDNEIFVFGSNEAGRHGMGAAKRAKDDFGAIYGQGAGLQGQSYGIPTKDKDIKTLPLWDIAPYVDNFVAFVRVHPELHFLISRIGCGLAGYKDEEMVVLFLSLYGEDNVSLPAEWIRLMESKYHLDDTD